MNYSLLLDDGVRRGRTGDAPGMICGLRDAALLGLRPQRDRLLELLDGIWDVAKLAMPLLAVARWRSMAATSCRC